jgi:hypothetical protein
METRRWYCQLNGKMRRRVVTEPGPAGDRQAIVECLSLAYGAEKPVMLTPEETLALPAALAIAALLLVVCQTVGPRLRPLLATAGSG